MTAEAFKGRDALNVIEGEMRQFETKMDVFKRFVEQIVTGQFLNVKKDVDLAPKVKEGNVIDKMDVERELLKNQVVWIGRMNALFAGSLGTLSGMSMLHILVLMSNFDKDDFLAFYAGFATNMNLIFLLLGNLALVLGLSMSLIYK